MTPGTDLKTWTPLAFDPAPALIGQHSRLERLSVARHAAQLHAANEVDPSMWDYLGYGPFPSVGAYSGWAAGAEASVDPVFYAIGSDMGWGGVASFLRIDRDMGVIEIGHIALSAQLQRTPAATEAIHLMLAHAFDAGFRRVEWKCDAGNRRSQQAALRYGFTPEGVFRQHMVVKGRNRDTAWFAIIDKDWPAIAKAHQAWLDPSNFDAGGQQRTSLRHWVLASDAPSGDGPVQ